MGSDAQRRALLGRLAGWLFLAAALALLPARVLLPTPGAPGWILALDAAAVATAVVCLRLPWARLDDRALHLVVLAAVAEITAEVAAAGDHGGVYAWYYLLVAIFVAYAFRRRAAVVAHLVIVQAAMWLGVLLRGDGIRMDQDALVQALVGGPMIIVAAVTVVLLRERLDADQRELRDRARAAAEHSQTDPLTGLGNRRRLLADLEAALADGPDASPHRLALFDLNGFKAYNDAFGHPAGDALLRRLGRALAAAALPQGRAYRLGGDEFCLLLDDEGPKASEACVERAARALQDRSDVFVIDAARGVACTPGEATTAAAAIALADMRMYAAKNTRSLSAAAQSCEVLVRVITERRPDLGQHLHEVAELARATARELALEPEQVDEVVRAAQLHDIGKSAIPDAILAKPGPLDSEEWAFVQRHTLVGERILLAAPALTPVARLVRASHERVDGTGYPDGLAGEDIPVGARIVAVCDAYHAMTDAERPYRHPFGSDEALAELDRCSGEQFDARVVAAFRRVITRRGLVTAD